MSLPPEEDAPSGPNGHQKRVMPTRVRRGGPGIGSTEVDMQILAEMKRHREYIGLCITDVCS